MLASLSRVCRQRDGSPSGADDALLLHELLLQVFLQRWVGPAVRRGGADPDQGGGVGDRVAVRREAGAASAPAPSAADVGRSPGEGVGPGDARRGPRTRGQVSSAGGAAGGLVGRLLLPQAEKLL